MDSAQKIAKLGDAEDLRKKLDENRAKSIESDKNKNTEIAELTTKILAANHDKQQALNKCKELENEIQQAKVCYYFKIVQK